MKARLTLVVAIVALALAGYAAFKPAASPALGYTSAQQLADNYVHAVAEQTGLTILRSRVIAYRNLNPNRSVIRLEVDYLDPYRLPHHALLVIKFQRTTWQLTVQKQISGS